MPESRPEVGVIKRAISDIETTGLTEEEIQWVISALQGYLYYHVSGVARVAD